MTEDPLLTVIHRNCRCAALALGQAGPSERRPAPGNKNHPATSTAAMARYFLSWHQKWRCDADEARALGMMRRVGARMRMREVVEAVSEWRAAAAAGVLQMVQPSMVLSAFLRNVLCLAVAAAAGAVRTQSQRA